MTARAPADRCGDGVRGRMARAARFRSLHHPPPFGRYHGLRPSHTARPYTTERYTAYPAAVHRYHLYVRRTPAVAHHPPAHHRYRSHRYVPPAARRSPSCSSNLDDFNWPLEPFDRCSLFNRFASSG